jgi:major membrane immunogen (membrane-anchored lipoprotein)
MMPSSSARVASLAVLFVLCFVLTGCGKSKVTKENFDKITNDMTLAQVEAILGEGDKQGDAANMAAQVGVDVTGGAGSPATTDYAWESGQKSITVTFKGGKVISKRNAGL